MGGFFKLVPKTSQKHGFQYWLKWSNDLDASGDPILGPIKQPIHPNTNKKQDAAHEPACSHVC